jgi:hypothetical protein
MGDRANVFIRSSWDKDEARGVFLYTHWGGESLPGVVAEALERGRSRWGDDQYLARIIFCQMVAGQEMETTGFGISCRMGDYGWPTIAIDTRSRSVGFVSERDFNKDAWIRRGKTEEEALRFALEVVPDDIVYGVRRMEEFVKDPRWCLCRDGSPCDYCAIAAKPERYSD